ncbi:MAG: hypothetical protein ABIJ23_03155 [Candidatus Magasanikbacteria bacterium]
MKIGFGIGVTEDVYLRIYILRELEKKMKEFFSKKNYGSSIKNYVIGISIDAEPFASFLKERKPKYTKGKKTLTVDRRPYDIEDCFEYSSRIDHDKFMKANDKEALCILANDIYSSIDLVDKFKKRMDDFNKEKFKNDMKNFFKVEYDIEL